MQLKLQKFFLCLGLTILTALPNPEWTFASEKDLNYLMRAATVRVSSLNLRHGPGTQYKVLEVLQGGTPVIICLNHAGVGSGLPPNKVRPDGRSSSTSNRNTRGGSFLKKMYFRCREANPLSFPRRPPSGLLWSMSRDSMSVRTRHALRDFRHPFGRTTNPPARSAKKPLGKDPSQRNRGRLGCRKIPEPDRCRS
ncbi:MAG: hypothetical protein Ct9H90mP9_5720 [Pseudomonadota bacterium]|nr:MAG: hypothetical protein Ct9H90mP9_5720 [Pseudomonadota bacterium]